ncbi:MAG: hypothetical protein Q4E91_01575 [Lachnospiraceae bacterium]|nr:hypothetical protein [Lachnospiraceae bacterium]
MIITVMMPIYIAMWVLAVHIQYLMRNEKRPDRMWIYPVFTMIGISFLALIGFLSH